MKKLKFGKGNKKLGKDTLVYSHPAGITCPGANSCKAWITLKDDKRILNRGNESLFTCFAASEELRYPNVYNSRRYNYQVIKSYVLNSDLIGLTELINWNIQINKKNITKVRIHESGDFDNLLYLQAWLNVAKLNPGIKFYCYSKSLNLFLEVLLPNNFYMVASYGGRYDHLIDTGYFPKYSKVVFSEEEAIRLGLKIDKMIAYVLEINPLHYFYTGCKRKVARPGKL